MARTFTPNVMTRSRISICVSDNKPHCSTLTAYIPFLTVIDVCKNTEYSGCSSTGNVTHRMDGHRRRTRVINSKNNSEDRINIRRSTLFPTATVIAITLFALIQPCFGIVNFFSKDDLKFTFGVNHHKEVPRFKHIYPQVVYSPDRSKLLRIGFDLNGEQEWLDLEPATADLFADRYTVVKRQYDRGGGSLHVSGSDYKNNEVQDARFDDCHYQHMSNRTYASVSHCDESVKGVIVREDGIYVIHPIPDRHSSRMRRSADNAPLHVIYKRSLEQQDFCGIENTISSQELNEDESGVIEDVFVIGQKLQQDSELTVELGVFVDETLWRQFSSKHGTAAWQKLQQYSVTMLNNIQIMYKQPTAVPRLVFRIVRYEVFMAQPSVLAPHLHDHGHAQKYLDMFCRYQRSLGIRDWDHAILLTGYDIHRGSGSRSISGIARLDGMCDPWNTCTLAEGLDFTAAFIGTHELGHSVGMRHDEPYCQSRFIMSASLGPGKVTWSTCSLRDYHTFLQRLDSKTKNCLRTSMLREKIPIENSLKPGQIYNANLQCTLMHGAGYMQVSPRQDHYDGICYMMWCGQGAFGRIITSHPALEGTFCGPSKWCELGRCVPWTGFGAPLPLVPALPAPPPPPPSVQPATTTVAARPQQPPPPPPPPQPQAPQSARTDGQWSAWSALNCQQCFCPPIAGSVGVSLSSRACSAPAPLNGGAECEGSSQRAAVCAKRCPNDSETVNQFISRKCADHKRIKADAELTGTGSQLSRYPQRACKVFCDVVARTVEKNYRFYGDNLPDGTACGWNRYCVGGECLDLSCDESILLPRDVGCPHSSDRCPLTGAEAARREPPRGQWGTWSLWSSCTVSCGAGGYQIRSRTCSVSNGCEGAPSERNACNTQPCPPPARNGDPQWTDWTPWNQCSVSCGRGSQARYRRCQTPQLTIAFSCPGQTMDIRDCDELPCAPAAPSKSGVGEWANWVGWSACSTTCGPGTQLRSRECKKEPCDGSGQQRMACNLRECVSWSDWGNWTECSRLCGKGIRSRSRLCPSGAVCSGSSIDQGFCNEQPCTPATAQVGSWSSWSAWSVCSLTCGAGVKRRTRHCQGGNCPGAFRESAICNEATCSVNDANWGGWGYWSSCSETCGNGIRRRVRKCYGSGNCYGNEYERENCHMRAC